jgi:hypothetical protein
VSENSSSTSIALVELESVRPVTGLELTVIVQLALIELSSALVAVIVALPTPMAVILPVASTVATPRLSEDQLTVLLVAFAGSTVALGENVSPGTIVLEVSESVTLVTGIVTAVTVTVHVAKASGLLTEVAVIIAVPGFIASTSPLRSTLATLSLLDVQLRLLSYA